MFILVSDIHAILLFLKLANNLSFTILEPAIFLLNTYIAKIQENKLILCQIIRHITNRKSAFVCLVIVYLLLIISQSWHTISSQILLPSPVILQIILLVYLIIQIII